MGGGVGCVGVHVCSTDVQYHTATCYQRAYLCGWWWWVVGGGVGCVSVHVCSTGVRYHTATWHQRAYLCGWWWWWWVVGGAAIGLTSRAAELLKPLPRGTSDEMAMSKPTTTPLGVGGGGWVGRDAGVQCLPASMHRSGCGDRPWTRARSGPHSHELANVLHDNAAHVVDPVPLGLGLRGPNMCVRECSCGAKNSKRLQARVVHASKRVGGTQLHGRGVVGARPGVPTYAQGLRVELHHGALHVGGGHSANLGDEGHRGRNGVGTARRLA